MIGPLQAQLQGLSYLKNQRVVLFTSVKGAQRRSTGLTKLLLQRMNCTVLPQIVSEPSLQASVQCVKLVQHTNANVLIGLGGSTVLDMTKFVCHQTQADYLLTIPTLPCAGKETSLDIHLFDFVEESPLSFQLTPPTQYSCLVDAQLGSDDKIPLTTDCRAFLHTLITGFYACPEKEEFLRHGQGAIQSLIRTVDNTPLASSQRQLLFQTSLAISSTPTSHNFHAALTNAICQTIPLPRTWVSAALCYPFLMKELDRGKTIQELTGSQSNADAQQILHRLALKSKLESGLMDLLLQFFDGPNVEKMIVQLVEIFEQTAKSFPTHLTAADVIAIK